jgi:phosphocarrier protein
VQKANEFDCSIWLESGSRKMNAKSLLGIMSLGIVTGAVITLSADGADAEAAVNALEVLLQRDVY